jgi:hypothetical protein
LRFSGWGPLAQFLRRREPFVPIAVCGRRIDGGQAQTLPPPAELASFDSELPLDPCGVIPQLLANVDLPKLKGKALVQSHCHHKAILHFDDEEKVLKKLGLEVDQPDSGCCGMAGAFGFEPDKYELSMRVGERVLLPAVREASRDTIIVADGFSCREQIAQGTDREALHLAQVLQLAMKNEAPGELPERRFADVAATLDVPTLAWKAAGIAGGIALFAGGIALLRRRRRKKSNASR